MFNTQKEFTISRHSNSQSKHFSLKSKTKSSRLSAFAVKKNNHVPFLITAVRWLFPKLEVVAPFIAQWIFRLAFYIPAKYPIPQKEKDAAAQAELLSMELNGKKLQGYCWGNKSLPYVLIMHGWAGRTTQFRKFIEPLNEAGYRVIGFDGSAHGNSGGRQTTILEFEQLLRKIFDDFGAPVAVIAHSFGGAASLYSAMNGLPIHTLINIASPTIADEILKTYMRGMNGSWKTAETFKRFTKKRTGKEFDEFTGLYSLQRLPHPIRLLMIHDEDDPDVYLIHAEEALKTYPSAKLIKTKGLGHTRILKDEYVIKECIAFVEKEGENREVKN